MKPLHHARAKKWRTLDWYELLPYDRMPFYLRRQRRRCRNCNAKATVYALENVVRRTNGYSRTCTVTTFACASCLAQTKDDIMDLIAKMEQNHEPQTTVSEAGIDQSRYDAP